MTSYTHKLNPIFSHFNPDLTQTLLVSVFGENYAKSLYFSEDAEEAVEGALYFIQNNFSDILLLDALTGEILHTIPISGTPTEQQEELLCNFSAGDMGAGAHKGKKTADANRENRLFLYYAKEYCEQIHTLFWRMDCNALRQIFNGVVGEEVAQEMWDTLDKRFFIEMKNLQVSIYKIVEIDRISGAVVKEIVLDDQTLSSDPSALFVNQKENIFVPERMNAEEAKRILIRYFDSSKAKPEFSTSEGAVEFNGHEHYYRQYAMESWYKEGKRTVATRVKMWDCYDRFFKGKLHWARIVERGTNDVLLDCYGVVEWYEFFAELAKKGVAFDLYTVSPRLGDDGLHRVTKFNHCRTHQRKNGTWYIDPDR